MSEETPKCSLCGEPMPEGEEMFMYHGYSGPCPKPPLKQQPCKCNDLKRLGGPIHGEHDYYCPLCGKQYVAEESKITVTFGMPKQEAGNE